MYKRIFEYIRIFEYFPPNIDIHIRFDAISRSRILFEYSNILSVIFPNIGLKKSEEMLELKKFYFHFLLEKTLIQQKSKAVII